LPKDKLPVCLGLGKCPSGGGHSGNGEEYCLGCGVCRSERGDSKDFWCSTKLNYYFYENLYDYINELKNFIVYNFFDFENNNNKKVVNRWNILCVNKFYFLRIDR
jgi:hypothetical protein